MWGFFWAANVPISVFYHVPCALFFCCCLYLLRCTYVIACVYVPFFLCFSTLYRHNCVCVYPFTCCCMYILYVKFLYLCNCLCTCFCAIIPSTTLHVFVCTPSQMVTLCLFWCPVNIRTLDDCRFSFPWVQVSVSQTTEYCLYCGLLPCTHSSALCLGHALGEPFLHALL